MTTEELKRDITIHYDDGIAMNDHDTAVESIICSAEQYANQRVIEELEKLKEEYIFQSIRCYQINGKPKDYIYDKTRIVEVEDIDILIKKLKQ